MQKVIGINRRAYWPMHFTSKVNQPQNILVGVNSNPGIEPGCYIQGLGTVRIGNNSQFGPNVGVISANHDVHDNNAFTKDAVVIGNDCWVGMNSVVLPGVVLGDFTVVGAGSVVTHSFSDGYCVVAGNPARKVRELDRATCVSGDATRGYVGYYRAGDFESYRKRKLWV